MNEHLRAGDRDREDVVAQLREQYAQGRLDREEFDERTDAAYAAKTFGDLRALTVDLPVAATAPADGDMPAESAAGSCRPNPVGRLLRPLTLVAFAVLICTVVGLVTRHGSPRPIVPIVFIAIAMARFARYGHRRHVREWRTRRG